MNKNYLDKKDLVMKKLLLVVITLQFSWGFADNNFVRSEAKTFCEFNGSVKSVKMHSSIDDHRYMDINVDFDQQGTGINAYINQVGFTSLPRQIYKISMPYDDNKRVIYSFVDEGKADKIFGQLWRLLYQGFTQTVYQEWFENYSYTAEESNEVGVMEFFNSEDQLIRLKNQYGESFYHYVSFAEWQAQDMNHYSDNDRLVVMATEQEIESIEMNQIPNNTEIKVKLSVDQYDNPIQAHIYTQYGRTENTYQYEYYDVK